MDRVIIANVISLAGSILMVLIGLIKTRRNIFLAQTAMYGIFALSNLLLNGFSGMVSNLLGMIRNLFGLKNLLRPWVKALFIALQAGLVALGGSSEGWLGWMPVLSAAVFTAFMDCGNEKLLKGVILAVQFPWILYDIAKQNYSAAAFDIFTIISNLIGILMLEKSAKKNQN